MTQIQFGSLLPRTLPKSNRQQSGIHQAFNLLCNTGFNAISDHALQLQSLLPSTTISALLQPVTMPEDGSDQMAYFKGTGLVDLFAVVDVVIS